MTATHCHDTNHEKVKEVWKAVGRLPEDDRIRLRELTELFRAAQEAQDEEEAQEILDVIAEMLTPYLVPNAPRTTEPVDLEADVTEDAKRRVRAYRRYVGRQIRIRRKAAQMTQEELADKAGIPQPHLCRLERGAHTPTDLTLEKIASALGINPSQLDPSGEP